MERFSSEVESFRIEAPSIGNVEIPDSRDRATFEGRDYYAGKGLNEDDGGEG